LRADVTPRWLSHLLVLVVLQFPLELMSASNTKTTINEMVLS
jgi:hypothetical protein